ncbi:unnamed protein product [Chrysoparadoxa australica]
MRGLTLVRLSLGCTLCAFAFAVPSTTVTCFARGAPKRQSGAGLCMATPEWLLPPPSAPRWLQIPDNPIQELVKAVQGLLQRGGTGQQSNTAAGVSTNVHDGTALPPGMADANARSLEHVLKVINSGGWAHVTSSHGITVEKKYVGSMEEEWQEHGDEDVDVSVVDVERAAKFACVKATGTLKAKAEDIYALFHSNDRVHEYNENCKEVRDLEEFEGGATKISWSRSPRMGPFKARDFITVVHYTELEDGTLAVVNHPVNHKLAPITKQFIRAEILIATNMMRPNPKDNSLTDFISVTHINPGGIVDSAIGAKLMNALCAKAPVKMLKCLEKAANSPPAPRPAS